MPIYVYKCKECGFEREILRRAVGYKVMQTLPEVAGCPDHGEMKLVVGRGVIARYGRQWVIRNMFDDGSLEKEAKESVDNMATETNLKKKYAATTQISLT